MARPARVKRRSRSTLRRRNPTAASVSGPLNQDQLERLQRAARHFAAIVASSDDAIISTMLDGTVVTWNTAAERLFGYTAAEIVGRSIRLIVPRDRQTEEDQVLSAVSQGTTTEHFETVR